MTKNIEKFLKDLIYSLQMAKLYGVMHLKFDASVDTLYNSLQDILKEKGELVVGIVGEELICENEIFYDLSTIAKPIIGYFAGIKIARISFLGAVEKDELRKFSGFIVFYKEEQGKSPQEQLESIGIINILIGSMESADDYSSSAESEEYETDNTLLYDYALNKISEEVDNFMDNKEIDYLSIKLIINNVLNSLVKNYQELLKLATIKRYDSQTYSHLLNVSILSMYFASKLGLPQEDSMSIGIAGLFHDIGKLYISRKIMNEHVKLTDEEFNIMKSHVVLGAEILLKYVDKIGVLPVVVAFEHHIKYDLKGYPKSPVARKANFASSIVSICDVYDALSQKRSYKDDYAPNMIYTIMSKDRGSVFEPRLLDFFFKIMGVWPIGTIVVLTDNSVAVVRQEDEDAIFSPKVEVINSAGKRNMVELINLKGQIAIEHYLNPFKEGKEYLKYI